MASCVETKMAWNHYFSPLGLIILGFTEFILLLYQNPLASPHPFPLYCCYVQHWRYVSVRRVVCPARLSHCTQAFCGLLLSVHRTLRTMLIQQMTTLLAKVVLRSVFVLVLLWCAQSSLLTPHGCFSHSSLQLAFLWMEEGC